jgi:ligand-binding SRPBCC domain-containing protein
MASHAFEVSSVVPATPEAVWARVSTMEGVNHELRPLARMTYPKRAAGMRLDPAVVPLGERLFRSWVLLFGFLPVDYDDLTLVRIEPGRGFLESSRMLSQRRWTHERRLEPVAGGCRVTDRIAFEPRLALLGRAFLPVFRFFFRHRHRRLASFLGRGLPGGRPTDYKRERAVAE